MEHVNVNNIRKLQELFKGRFTFEEMGSLIYRIRGNNRTVVTTILLSEPEDLQEIINEEADNDLLMEKLRNVQIQYSRDQMIKSGKIETNSSLFACQACDNVWWRRVPSRKPVSKCNFCRVRFYSVPKEHEFGWAEFNCNCERTFYGFCQMGKSSRCFGCHELVMPVRILPPRNDSTRRTPNHHSCEGCENPFNGIIFCYHPGMRRRLRLPQVVTPSMVHCSSGSTVDTCIDQQDLNERYQDVFDEIIEEEDE